MKILFFLASALLPANGWASLQECRSFTTNVLQKAVTEDPKVTDSHPYRMNKDEKKSLEYINKFDVKKLGLKLNKDARTEILKDCQQLANKTAAEAFCNNSIDIYNYFRSLIHASKNYSWSSQTVSLAKTQMSAYINEVVATESSLLDTILATNLLQDAAKAGIVKGLDTKAINTLAQELEKGNVQLRNNMQNRAGPMDCQGFQGIAAQEIKMNAQFVKRLEKLNKIK